MQIEEYLNIQNLDDNLKKEILDFRKKMHLRPDLERKIPVPSFRYRGKASLEKAIIALLNGSNILIQGPKATGKNVLAQNLAYIFARPIYTVSLNINSDSEALIGADTFKNNEVVFREGPVLRAAKEGGFLIFDEINMARNEALSVLHSLLDFRRILDLPGGEIVEINKAARFIGTMNYGYMGTRELNEALVSRFMVINLELISEEDLKGLLREVLPLKEDYVKIFSRLFKDLEEKSLKSEISSRPIDLRGLIEALKLMKKGLGIYPALEMGLVHKSFDKYENQVVEDVIKTLIPKTTKAEEIFK
ncbi:ATPase family protein [Clostridiales bacterium KA00134]|nr:ATPase family protein [Clostridiales bacterium KA00134]